MNPQPFAILVQPCPQGKPLADEGFVRDLGYTFVRRHQPRIGQQFDDGLDGGPILFARDKFGKLNAAASVLSAFAQFGEA